MSWILILTATLILLPFAKAEDSSEKEGQKICETRDLQGVTFRYCAFIGDRKKNRDLVYFLHGAGGNEQQWLGDNMFDGAPLYSYWKRQRKAAPTVISISFQTGQWVVSDLPIPGQQLSYREIIEQQVFPYVEGRWPLGSKGRRMIMGTSMGGYNAYVLWLSSPQLYAKAAPLCAGVSDLSPYAGNDEMEKLLNRKSGWFNRPVKADALQTYKKIFGPFFQGSTEVWLKNRAQALVKAKGKYKNSRLYVSYNKGDEFGFGFFNKDFVDVLLGHGVSLTAVANNESHCVGVFTDGLAAFLVK